MTASWNHPQRLRARLSPTDPMWKRKKPMPDSPPSSLAARGAPTRVEVHWSDEHYDAPPARVEAADAAIAAAPTAARRHDGLSARLVSHEEHGRQLT
jgi:hypothetical protein